jgi:hypothetical protein
MMETVDTKYAALKAEIAIVQNQIRDAIKPGSVEDSLYKGFIIWFSKLSYKPPFLFIGLNPGAGYYNDTGVKYRDSDLDPSEVFEYLSYHHCLANETIQVFKDANRLGELEKSVKFNIHYLVTSNQKDLFALQGILLDKYNINMYAKAKDWTMRLIDIIEPECIICEGAYPANKLAYYYDQKIGWKNHVCQFTINNEIPVLAYKRLFSRIINKKELANKIAHQV